MEISICIPAYKNIECIKRLFESIECQTFIDYEVVVTDDSETFEIRDVFLEYFAKENWVYIHNESRIGPTANCNKAISLANGRFIKVMHQDDCFSRRDSLEKMYALIESDSYDFAFCGTIQIKDEVKFKRNASKRDIKRLRKSNEYILYKNFVGGPSAAIWRNEGNYLDEKLKWIVDVDFYLGMLIKKKRFTYTCDNLITVFENKEQVTNECINNFELNCREYSYVMQKYGLLFNSISQIAFLGMLRNFGFKLGKNIYRYNALLFLDFVNSALDRIMNRFQLLTKKRVKDDRNRIV